MKTSSGASPLDERRFAPAICWACVVGLTPFWLVSLLTKRKPNYAAYVKQMTPHCPSRGVRHSYFTWDYII